MNRWSHLTLTRRAAPTHAAEGFNEKVRGSTYDRDSRRSCWEVGMTSTHAVELDAPDDEIPIALAVNLVLGRGPDVAILLPSVDVYTTGIQLQVQVRCARASNP